MSDTFKDFMNEVVGNTSFGKKRAIFGKPLTKPFKNPGKLTKNIRKNDKREVDNLFELPIKSINDIFMTSDGVYKIACEVSPINAALLVESDLVEVTKAIKAALHTYDGRVGINIQSESLNIKDNVEYIENYRLNIEDEEMDYLLADQINDLNMRSESARNVLRFYVILESHQRKYELAESDLISTLESFTIEMENGGFDVIRLFEKEFKETIYKRINIENHHVEPFKEHWRIANLYPEYAEPHIDGAKVTINNHVYNHFAVTEMPQGEIEDFLWLDRVLNFYFDRANYNFNVGIILTPKNPGRIQKSLSDSVGQYNHLAKKFKESNAALSGEYEERAEDSNAMLKELRSSGKFYDVCVVFGISANNEADLDKTTTAFRKAANSCDLTITELKNKDFDPFFLTLPILYDHEIAQKYVYNLSSHQFASLIPFNSSVYMDKRGIVFGENSISRGLVIVDTFNYELYNAPHTLITGDTGSGKTFLIQTQIARELPYIKEGVIFNMDGTLRNPYSKVIKFNTFKDGVCTNPFHISNTVADLDENGNLTTVTLGEFLPLKISYLEEYFSWFLPRNDNGFIDPLLSATLLEDIEDTYDAGGINFESESLPDIFPTLDTFQRIVFRKFSDESGRYSEKDKERRGIILTALKPIISGAFKNMFNGQTNWKFARLSSLDMSQTPDKVLHALYSLLTTEVWQWAKRDGTIDYAEGNIKKLIVLDEAHIWAKAKISMMMKFLSEKLTKQSRKFGVRLIVATQNITDILKAEHGEGVIGNCFFKVFLRVPETDVETITKLYRFNDEEMKIISPITLGSKKVRSKGKAILIAGGYRVTLNTYATRNEFEYIAPGRFKATYGVEPRSYEEIRRAVA